MRSRNINLLTFVVVALVAITSSKAALADTLLWESSDQQGDMVMSAAYGEFYYGALVDQRIEVRVYNAPANTRFKVTVQGFGIGVVVTNEFGFGTFYKGRNGVPVGTDGRPLAPHVNTGDMLKVANANSGVTFAGEFNPN